ncbi:hypothetical protein EKO04_004681 [Ascochyta lentis]|uniref:Uncharacterized protein n=1 Tax=Ascochyta lentis TaxID=205686 RepID=A0A8H7J856_9PLEO|nr:hypothetical protein EKO04_004681 [Ascochyta lentis]
MATSTPPPEYTYTAPTTTNPPPPPSGSANISLREYIYYLPHPLPAGTPTPYTPGLPSKNPLNLPPHPFEPTHTLVLTSPGRSFVDLRYLKPQHAGDSDLPNAGETVRLEWGFAGHSSTTTSSSPPHPEYGVANHSTWTHWLDSRHRVGDPQIPVDEGDLYAISPTLTIECGAAFHPHLGRVAGHEEAWRDVVGSPVGIGTETTGLENFSALLRLHDDANGVRGVVLRVGRFCQAIVVLGARVSTERWEYIDHIDDGFTATSTSADFDGASTASPARCRTGWTRTARTGDCFLPCAATFRPQTLQLGGTVRYGEFEWVVEEVWECVD